jgi:hypothetical protein
VGFSRFILLRHRICVVQKKLMLFKLFALIEVFSSGGGMIEFSCEDLTLPLFSPSSSSCQICRWFILTLIGDSVPSVKS